MQAKDYIQKLRQNQESKKIGTFCIQNDIDYDIMQSQLASVLPDITAHGFLVIKMYLQGTHYDELFYTQSTFKDLLHQVMEHYYYYMVTFALDQKRHLMMDVSSGNPQTDVRLMFIPLSKDIKCQSKTSAKRALSLVAQAKIMPVTLNKN